MPETAYLNAGALKSMNAANKQSMLYYENHLAKWLKTHKGYRLDYQVTPLYRNDELLPRQVRLAYVGYNPRGEKVKINLHSYREENGTFKNRKQLLKVAKLGPKAFEQCAGFLRVSGGDEPLDATGVHPDYALRSSAKMP